MIKPVLITRPAPDGEQLAEECRLLGFKPIIVPLMSVRFRADLLTKRNHSALAFTSANGVRAYAQASTDRAKPTFCVGSATATIAQQKGFTQVHVANGDVESLAQLIIDTAPNLSEPILHVAGTHRAGDLLALLERAQIRADRQVLYETVEETTLPDQASDALSRLEHLLVPLFSPRTATLLVTLIAQAGLQEAAAHAHAICLSEAVAQAARRLDWAHICVTSDKTTAAMLDKLTQHA